MEKPKILVINGDKHFRRQLIWALEEDFELFEAEDRDTAIQYLEKEKRPDVILMELFFSPRPDYLDEGFTPLNKFKETAPEVKIIVVTTIDRRDIIDKTRELGADDYILKPFSVQHLKNSIKKVTSEPILKGIEKRRYWRGKDGTLVGIERRRYRRVAYEAHTSYSVISKKKEGAFKKTVTMNVSPSGVMFPVTHHIAPDTLLDIELFLPPRSFFHTSAVTAKAIGEVRWAKRVNGTQRYNLGVQFTQIKNEDRKRIADYIY